MYSSLHHSCGPSTEPPSHGCRISQQNNFELSDGNFITSLAAANFPNKQGQYVSSGDEGMLRFK